jgi:hypothetical protein
MGLWSTLDMVAINDKLTFVYSRGSDPFQYPEKLEYVKDDTFKIDEVDSFASEGELVHFHLSNGKTEWIIYAGEKLIPEKAYMKNLKAKNKITLGGE